MPSFPPTGLNSVRKQAATAEIRKEGKRTWHQKAPRKAHCLTLTLPPLVLAARCPLHILTAKAKRHFLWGSSNLTFQCLGVYCQVTSSLPLLMTSQRDTNSLLPHFFSSHLLCACFKSLTKPLDGTGGWGIGGGICTARNPPSWHYARHFSITGCHCSTSQTENTKTWGEKN